MYFLYVANRTNYEMRVVFRCVVASTSPAMPSPPPNQYIVTPQAEQRYIYDITSYNRPKSNIQFSVTPESVAACRRIRCERILTAIQNAVVQIKVSYDISSGVTN